MIPIILALPDLDLFQFIRMKWKQELDRDHTREALIKFLLCVALRTLC